MRGNIGAGDYMCRYDFNISSKLLGHELGHELLGHELFLHKMLTRKELQVEPSVI